MDTYKKLSTPPKWALKPIGAGRLKGMTDISPQWRYQVMTEVFGLCGIGWKFEVIKKWTEQGPDNQVCAFVDIHLYVKQDEWSAPIPGTGGSMLVAKESKGPHVSDECWKMATTDALSSAMKVIGVAADIYAGHWDGSKYRTVDAPPTAVTYEQLVALTEKWKQLHADELTGLDKDARKNSFRGWVKLVLGDAFESAGPFNVGDFSQWRKADYDECLGKLNPVATEPPYA